MKRHLTAAFAIGLMIFSGQAKSFTIADTPLFVTGNVAPNIVLTLDDSGSMRRAFVPDTPTVALGGIYCGDSSDCAALDNRYAKSNYANALYYNPNVTYEAPKKWNGSAYVAYSAPTFAAAYRNGFYTSGTVGGVNFGTTVNLGTAYMPTARLDMAISPPEAFSYPEDGHSGDTGASAMFTINDYQNANGSGGTNNPGTNLLSVIVNGVAQTRSGATTSSTCASGRPTVDNQFSTYISGTTLTLCFRNNATMRNKTIALAHMKSSAGSAYYNVFNGAKAGCTGTAAQKKASNHCYDTVIVSATSGPGNTDERQNFANWYSFYRTRMLATTSGAALAFADLDSTTRVSWQALNTCRGSSTSLVDTSCDGWTGTYGSNAIKAFSNSTHKQNFSNWLARVPTDGNTSLRESMIRAGEYFSTSGENSPYDNDFSTASSGEYTCRRNFHILMTDGIWNDSTPSNINNRDNTAIANLPDDPTGTPYDPTQTYARVYKDATSNTLADVAFKYWATDLRGLTDNVTPVVNEVDADGNNLKDSDQQIFWNAKNDPATWQHMVNFTIGLGLKDFLAAGGLTWTGDMYAGSYLSIRDGTQTWPAATAQSGTDANYGTSAFDLWHAAINSRGRFFSAESPDDITNAFQTIMAQIKAATPTSAALAANSTKAEIGTRVYQAKFGTTTWNGHLYAYDVNPANGSLSPAAWDAATAMPAHGSRNIYIRNASGGASFDWANLTSTQESDLDAGGLGQDRVAWIRGDITKEARFSGGIFRNREIKQFEKVNASDPNFWLLGDIVNSDPEYVGVGSQGYDQLPSGSPGQSTYGSYVSSHKATRPPAIYVGANDGMLHAFRTTDGVELFAVIPNAVFPDLADLTSPSYSHQFYVDGSPSSGDAYLSNGLSVSGWNTVVVTGLGAGGNSILAVDATSTATTSASRFMWEYTDTDMGYTYSQPQVARMNDGSWAAVFGNGYKTSGGGAYLYVVNLADGTLIKKIQAGTDANNGLSTPIMLDTNNDKIMDTAYAGDLQGNMWKFDLSSGTSSSWALANAGTPLFIAKDALGNRQPITVQPSVANEAVNGGYWVFFGTGKYFALEDVQTTEMGKTQSFYGIWDNGVAVPSYLLRTDPSFTLLAQTVTNTTTSNGFDVRVTSNNTVNLSSSVRGWYMDLPGNGERVVSESVTIISNIDNAENRIIFVTVLPSSDPCDSGGSSWLMEVLFKGNRPASPVFDLDADGTFGAGDMVTVNIGGTDTAVPVSGVKSIVGILDTPTWLDKDAAMAFKLAPGTSGGVVTITNKGKGGTGTATRVFWQQLM
jgi:type IV pilus assembly protein PilY1